MWERRAKRAYQRAWAREQRQQRARAEWDGGVRTRRVVNMLGRVGCTPEQKWCAWGQHAVFHEGFNVALSRRSGYQDLCRECQQILARLAPVRRRQKERAAYG